MPIKHAALRQMRKDRKRQQRNQAVQAELRTLAKRLLSLLNERKVTEAGQLMQTVAKAYDRAASKRVIHPRRPPATSPALPADSSEWQRDDVAGWPGHLAISPLGHRRQLFRRTHFEHHLLKRQLRHRPTALRIDVQLPATLQQTLQ